MPKKTYLDALAEAATLCEAGIGFDYCHYDPVSKEFTFPWANDEVFLVKLNQLLDFKNRNGCVKNIRYGINIC